MKIGFTGTRNGMTEAQKNAFEDYLISLCFGKSGDEFHHGDCVGADEQSQEIAEIYGGADNFLHIHPCNLKEQRANCVGDIVYDELPPLERNKIIVDSCDILVAAPKGFEEELRSGTWSTIRYARKIGRQIVIILPDGSLLNGKKSLI